MNLKKSGDYYHGSLSRRRALWSYYTDKQKYVTHRLPGIVVTQKGTVIVYCEGRTHLESDRVGNGIDWCLMDIFIQRSCDDGETFESPIFIARGNTQYETMNNPVMIVGNDNTLHMFYCRNCTLGGGGAWYTFSTDDGLTWSRPRCLDVEIAAVPHALFLFGPGHGLCTSDGRLMVPVWLTDPITKEIAVYTVYSEDNGKSWKMSAKASDNKDETTIAELSDGSILLNSRRKPRRIITVSRNGIDGWSESRADENLPDPGCMGGMETVRVDGLPQALLFVNCASTDNRDHVCVKCSFDNGQSWQSLMIDEHEGGYADVAVNCRTGKTYVIYETFLGCITRITDFSFFDEFYKDKFISGELK